MLLLFDSSLNLRSNKHAVVVLYGPGFPNHGWIAHLLLNWKGKPKSFRDPNEASATVSSEPGVLAFAVPGHLCLAGRSSDDSRRQQPSGFGTPASVPRKRLSRHLLAVAATKKKEADRGRRAGVTTATAGGVASAVMLMPDGDAGAHVAVPRAQGRATWPARGADTDLPCRRGVPACLAPPKTRGGACRRGVAHGPRVRSGPVRSSSAGQ